MKKILYIGNKLSKKGKTESTIDTLETGLKSLGFQVNSVSSYKSIIFRFLDMLWTVFKHRKTVDYVLIDTYSTLNFYYAYFVSQLCRFFKINYIPILHGGELPKRLLKSPKLSKAVFKHAFKNVAPSLYLKSHFEANNFNNIVYIPNSIKIEDYKFQKKTYKSIKLLWVRSFSEIYNPWLAIHILKALKNENIDAELCMIGPEKDGSLESTKSLAKSLNVEVEFTGLLSKNDWHKKADGFNVFINTTTIDNTPVSVIEAMALGLPVVSTNVGGMPFLIENNKDGVLVASNNIEAFVSAIKVLISDVNKTQEMVNRARQKVEGYAWNKVKQQWYNLLS
ncbi:glycosyltransferase family 4 protein [Algibacter lectus]|uniref:Glycosyltransferase involved in cell wall biosynthesis n=1 Tax=Algibacter lectus TaxID=221126 RepID=A0A4R8MFN1_9FLAO|nr:glycosyltransferase family 4 protein [Algibacter lectus]MWW24846.1 glycosyltransferase [Algibacter lectus]TDY64743.1 glycosyltransferase involved in cell wall biosynthesis [Algibacter lectus]